MSFLFVGRNCVGLGLVTTFYIQKRKSVTRTLKRFRVKGYIFAVEFVPLKALVPKPIFYY
jgi:hypothetical protein